MFISFLTVFLGTLWCSIKKIEAPYMFDWEYLLLRENSAGMAIRNSTLFSEVRTPI